MASRANPTRSRMVSLVCLAAILIVLLPVPVCAASMQPMQMKHCAGCCPDLPSVVASCCHAHPQPAAQTSGIAHAPSPASHLALQANLRGLSEVAPVRALIRNAPPPPLQTILRI